MNTWGKDNMHGRYRRSSWIPGVRKICMAGTGGFYESLLRVKKYYRKRESQCIQQSAKNY